MGGGFNFNPVKIIKRPIKQITKPIKKLPKKIVKELGDLPKDIQSVGAEIVEPFEKPTQQLIKTILSPLTPEITPATTPEVTPERDEEVQVAEEETIMGRGRRRTKAKRAGQAGTILEGYGALYRRGSPKSVS